MELYGDKDPALPLRPGETAEFEFRVIPEGPGSRYYGYLMVESFDEAAVVERAAGMSLLAVGDRYATSTVPGEERTARFALKVREKVARDAFFVPQLRAGIIADGGSSLTASTRSIKQLGYRIASFPAQGRKLTVPPGYRGVLDGLTDGLGEGARLVGVGPARYGDTGVGRDGLVTYSPVSGFAGYDSFDYVLADATDRLTRTQVTVFVGDLSATPGVIAG
ncbi:cadherin-like domain-containing protein [Streptomyces sp. OR43]|uniref:cadherin-like domain-containing protein n=1 Tax=Streptomyces sp. or43 TaxID=2478957 RepID=UPI0021C79D3E|nr:cadherin-like domain-containing protein [Streptomyces sp. or43]